MIGSPMERRRAERFAELLEAAEGRRRRRHNRTGFDDELSTLVDIGAKLTALAPSAAVASAPTPQFQAEFRERLMERARGEGVGDEEPDLTGEVTNPVGEERRAPGSRRRMLVAAALAAGVLGLSGVSTASGDAVPGDTLYGMKRSTERAQLALAGSDVNRGQLYLEFARTRLGELKAIEAPTDLVATLDDMDVEVVQGMQALTTAAVDRQDTGILDTVDGFLAEHGDRLGEAMSYLAGKPHAAAFRSAELLDDAGQRSRQLRGSLLCTATSDAGADRFGPLPGECAALPGGDPHGRVIEPPLSDSPPPAASRDDDDRSEPADSASPESPAAAKPASPGPTPTVGTTDPLPADESDDSDGIFSDLGTVLSGILGS